MQDELGQESKVVMSFSRHNIRKELVINLQLIAILYVI